MAAAAPRTISSAWTPLYKLVFPIAWVAVCWGAGLRLGLPRGLLVAPLLIVALCFWYVLAGRLMVVHVDDSFLYVSNYRKGIRIPFADVIEITENRFVNIRPVTIHLGKATEFGSRLTFMPRVRFILFFRSHPIVAELNQLVAMAKANR